MEEEKMANCEECGKKLGLLESYNHPTMGRKHSVCTQCYNQISESVELWKEFLITNSFNIESKTDDSSSFLIHTLSKIGYIRGFSRFNKIGKTGGMN
jgi:hypothetical protein